jgi:hypothetical protein
MPSNTETLRHQLLDHPLVQRLLNNPNWKPAALAAVDHFVDHKKCTVPSWVKSSTWAQVQMAYEELTQR